MGKFSLKKKLICWFLLCICIPMSIFIYAIIGYKNDIASRELERYALNQASLIADQCNWFFNSVKYVSKNYYNSSLVNEIANPNHDRSKQQYLKDQLDLLKMQKLNNYTFKDTTLQVTIITMDGHIYGTNLYRKSFNLEAMKNTGWYKQLTANQWNVLWIQDDFLRDLIFDDKNEKIFNIWVLKAPETYTPVGFLIVDFPVSDVESLFETYFDDDEIFLAKDMYDNFVILKGMGSTDPEIAAVDRSVKENATSIVVGKNHYYAASTEVSSAGWNISLLTTKSIAFYGYQDAFRLVYITLLLYSMIAVFFLIFISWQFVKPVQSLTMAMKTAQEGNLSVRANIRRNDEIGELAGTYDALLCRINELMNDIIIEQTEKRRAEMQALYTQINPHFIYNTLTSIRSLVYMGDREGADHALRAFASLLKNSLSREDELCTIEKEIDLAKKCIEIHQLSFERPVQVSFDVDESICNCKIIKMITQPIIENAFLHGLKAKRGSKALFLSFRRSGDDIDIEIRDNGAGTGRKFIFDTIRMEYDKNIGMQNIYNRIVLHHGEQYGIRFESAPGAGTAVTLHLPLIYQEEMTYDS